MYPSCVYFNETTQRYINNVIVITRQQAMLESNKRVSSTKNTNDDFQLWKSGISD